MLRRGDDPLPVAPPGAVALPAIDELEYLAGLRYAGGAAASACCGRGLPSSHRRRSRPRAAARANRGSRANAGSHAITYCGIGPADPGGGREDAHTPPTRDRSAFEATAKRLKKPGVTQTKKGRRKS